MEILERRAGSLLREPIGAQFADHQLAHGVEEISRIVSAARGLLTRIAWILIRLLAKHLLALRDRHAISVHTDGAHESYVTQQCIEQLTDVNVGRAVTDTGFPHQLFGVMRPAF